MKKLQKGWTHLAKLTLIGLILSCLTGCGSQTLNTILTMGLAANETYKYSNPPVREVVPYGIDVFIPDEGYESRWTAKEKQKLYLHNVTMERVLIE